MFNFPCAPSAFFTIVYEYQSFAANMAVARSAVIYRIEFVFAVHDVVSFDCIPDIMTSAKKADLLQRELASEEASAS
jgi:hypothetical protein